VKGLLRAAKSERQRDEQIFKPGACKLKAGLLRTLDKEASFPAFSQAIPPTLQESLMTRLDRLSPVREVAQIGSVIGRGFSCKLLNAVAGTDDAPRHPPGSEPPKSTSWPRAADP
jgi:hypothetical protein